MNLGALEGKKDRRDFDLGAYQGTVAIPNEYKADISQVEKQYQNGWPACGAHAGVHFKEIQEQGGNFSPAFLWNEIKKIDNFPPEVGTDMRSIFKTLLDKGVCDYALLPNDYSKNLIEYTHQVITQSMTENAKPKGISAYAFGFEPTPESIKQAIYQNKVILFLIWCDNGYFGTNTPTFTKKLYGHFVVAYGYDSEFVYILDSTENDTSHSTKRIPFINVDFIRIIGTAIDLPNQYIFKNNLYFGMQQNPEVKQLQLRLNVTPATGNFGPLTLAAVMRFQRDHNISPVHGFVGPLTRTALNTS